MPFENGNLFMQHQVPQSNGAIITTGGQGPAVRGKMDVMYGLRLRAFVDEEAHLHREEFMAS